MQRVLEKKCIFCAELIKREAVKCKHCGSFVTEEAFSSAPDLSAQSRRIEAIVFVVIISVPVIMGASMLAWVNSLPPAERERLQRVTEPIGPGS